MTARCRECNQQIMFVRMEDGGKALPVDPFPDPDGNVYGRNVRDVGFLGHVAHKDEPLPDGWRVYMPHFATCPYRIRVSAEDLTTYRPGPLDHEPPAPDLTLFDTTEGATP